MSSKQHIIRVILVGVNIVLFLFPCEMNAQLSTVLHEDFQNPAKNWVIGKQKKITVEATPGGKFFIKNDTRSKANLLLQAPMNSSKSYRITAKIERVSAESKIYPQFGIMIGAKDEKNGYALIIDGYNAVRLMRIESGKEDEYLGHRFNKLDEYYHKKLGVPGDTIEFKALITDTRWCLFIDEKLIFDLKPPRIEYGNSCGIYISNEVAINLTAYDVLEGGPGDVIKCNLPFTQEDFQDEFSKILCAASGNFEKIQGKLIPNGLGLNMFEMKDVKLPGEDQGILKTVASGLANKNGKLVRTEKMFASLYIKCVGADDREGAELLYSQYRLLFDGLRKTCLQYWPTLELNAEYDAPDDIIRRTWWETEFVSDLSGKGKLSHNLYLKKGVGTYYFIESIINY